MVSKLTRRTPTKANPTKPSPVRPRPSHHWKKVSPLKAAIAAAPSAVAASIDKSLRTCRRRLIKIFARLTTLASASATPKRRKRGFRRLRPFGDDPHPMTFLLQPATAAAAAAPLLPPASSPPRMTVFVDLDETLVHSKTGPPPDTYDFVVRPMIDGQVMIFYVRKRPGVDELLSKIAKGFEVVVFTAGLREYASLVLDQLDPAGEIFTHRLYRDSCREVEGGRFVKDLGMVGRDLGRVVIMDDNPNAYVLQPENAVPVSPFVDDASDRELQRVMGFFEVAELFEDTRDAVKFYLNDGDGKKAACLDDDVALDLAAPAAPELEEVKL